MNQSTRTSRAVLQALIDAGVRDVVVAPGSRSAGLAYAAAQAASAGILRLHTRIDEREAGFLALGLAKGSRRPVPVIVTSGTAVANLLPAVVEAHMSGVALVALTADRPERVRFSGAAQTIDQPPLLAAYVAQVVDLPVDARDATPVTEALAKATGTRHAPVHLNIQFDLPLMPYEADVEWEPVRATERARQVANAAGQRMQLPPRGVVIVGDVIDAAEAQRAGALAERLQWPLLWEPSSNAHGAPTAMSHGPLIAPHLPTPDAVLTVGTVGLSRSVMALLRATPEHIAVHLPANGPTRPDPMLTARQILDAVPDGVTTPDPEWLTVWRAADSAAAEVVDRALAAGTLSGPGAARALWSHVPAGATLMVGASWPVRHIEAYAPAGLGPSVVGSRGANGIDGLVSTAAGLALAGTGRTYLLVGDVSFLYGIAGLHGVAQADITVVVLDNDGSGIFSQLEQGAPAYQNHFERVFGTPHGHDLWAMAESYGIPTARVTTRDELESALTLTDRIPGAHVIVCTTGDRRDEAALIARIKDGVTAVLS